jgi:hypothetical protein
LFAYEFNNDTHWMMRYWDGGGGYSARWEFAGGPEYSDRRFGTQTVTSTSYIDVTWSSYQVTIPETGRYDLTLAARLLSPVNGLLYLTVKEGAATVTDSEAIFNGGNTGNHDARIQWKRLLVATKGDIIKLMTRISVSGTATLDTPDLRLVPRYFG